MGGVIHPLHQVDLLTPAERKITEKEYWAQRRGQEKLDELNQKMKEDGITPKGTRYQTEKQFLRDAIDDAASTARSPEEFSKILDEKYHIIFKISRNRYSYLHPGRKKYITGRNLGTRYTEDFLLKTFEENTKSHKEQKEEGLLVRGALLVSVLYQTGDERVPLATAKGTIPFEQLLEANGLTNNSHINLHGMLEQVSASLTGEKEIEIKAVAALDLLVFDRMEEPIVSGYESEEVDWDAFRSAPGMVGYVVQEKETLWDIAKKFFTTVEAIMEVNQKETEQVQTGDMILILKEVS